MEDLIHYPMSELVRKLRCRELHHRGVWAVVRPNSISIFFQVGTHEVLPSIFIHTYIEEGENEHEKKIQLVLRRVRSDCDGVFVHPISYGVLIF